MARPLPSPSQNIGNALECCRASDPTTATTCTGKNGTQLNLELTELPLNPWSVPHRLCPCTNFLTSLAQSPKSMVSVALEGKIPHMLFLTRRIPHSISFPRKCKLICQVSFRPQLCEMSTMLRPLLWNHSFPSRSRPCAHVKASEVFMG